MKKENILTIYTDESTSDGKRFKSICAVSGLMQSLSKLSKNLKEKLVSNGISSELKFSEVTRDRRKINCVKDFISIAIDYASREEIRIDTITWDLKDSRHSIRGRDDKENLERMYFHLLRNIVENWKIFHCIFCPDEHSEYEYSRIIEYLNNTKFPRNEPHIFKLFKEEKIEFNFIDVKKQKSEEQTLIQLADIFAGFVCFSREKSDEFKDYEKQKEHKEHKEQPLLSFPETDRKNEAEFKKAILNRFQIIEYIKELCENNRLSVSLRTDNYLKTFHCKTPINFWHYKPQGDYDKAPTKHKG